MDNGMYDYPYLGKARRIWIWDGKKGSSSRIFTDFWRTSQGGRVMEDII